jgi:hypothetical protein
MTYARARLWLGITTVGVMVMGSALLLAFDMPDRLARGWGDDVISDALVLAAAVFVYALVQLPFDLLGGLILPRRFGRLDTLPPTTLRRILLAAVLHAGIIWAIAMLLLAAGNAGGLLGVTIGGLLISIALLASRPALGAVIGNVRRNSDDPTSMRAPDQGFTGGIEGVIRPARIIVPDAWRTELGGTGLSRVLARRQAAIDGGSWIRGRILALTFTTTGIAVAGFTAGSGTLGSPEGIIRLALWFTLWSFIGLLTLPTLSRWAVQQADASLDDDQQDEEALRRVDRLGDDEPRRPAFVESIFHPVPSVDRRIRKAPPRGPAFWDVARTALFVSPAGLSLLGRAVHCNCGRPALWVYPPMA